MARGRAWRKILGGCLPVLLCAACLVPGREAREKGIMGSMYAASGRWYAPPPLPFGEAEARLVEAVRGRNAAAVMDALALGARPDAVGPDGDSAFSLALSRGDGDLVHLFPHQMTVRAEDVCAVLAAGRLDLVGDLLQQRPRLDLPCADGQSALSMAVRLGEPALVEAMLTGVADPFRPDLSGHDSFYYLKQRENLGGYRDADQNYDRIKLALQLYVR